MTIKIINCPTGKPKEEQYFITIYYNKIILGQIDSTNEMTKQIKDFKKIRKRSQILNCTRKLFENETIQFLDNYYQQYLKW